MIITNSNDISNFDIQVFWDISNVNPVIVINNESTLIGSPAPDVKFWFIVTSPTTTPIHEGSASNPDETGSWTTLTLADAWPKPFNQIEWGLYSIVAYAQDVAGNIYSFEIQQNICRPQGNSNISKNTYGKATLNLDVQCENANVFLEDTTNTSYQGISGSQILSTIKVIYPIDETDNIPDPFSANDFSAALVPITYSSNNYQYVQNSIYDYEFTSQSVVRIRYKSYDGATNTNAITFAVLCNIDLCPLICEIDKLMQSIENGTCGDAADAQNKLNRINPRLNMILIGIQQPLCGVDVPGLIEEIKIIGGFDCNCCSASTGIIPQTSSIIDDYVFSIVSVGGDISGTVVTNGNNIQFRLSDKKYIFKMCPDVPTEAFTVTPSTSGDGYTKTYCLNVDLTILATDLLDTIIGSQYLVNLFNSIVTSSGQTLVLDGKCIFASGIQYDYLFELTNIPLTTTFAIVTGITVGGVNRALNYSFNQGGLSGLETYLNSLGIGTFAITNDSGGAISIETVGNSNQLSTLSYNVSATNYVANQTTTNTGFVPVTPQYAVQMLINYICSLDTDQVYLNQEYEVCYIDENGVKQTIIVGDITSGDDQNNRLSNLLELLASKGCTNIEYVLNMKSVTCDSIKSLFVPSSTPIQPTDYILMTKGTECSISYPSELFLSMLQLLPYESSLIEAFCAALNLCSGGQPCRPYNIFNVQVITFNAECPEIIDFQYDFTGTTLNINVINFANTPSGNQTVSVYYKLQSNPSYTLYSGSVTVAPNGVPTVIPEIELTSGLVYDIRIVNSCSSPAVNFDKVVNAPGSPDQATIDVFNNSSVVTITGVTVGGTNIFSPEFLFPMPPDNDGSGLTNNLGTQTVVVTLTDVSPTRSIRIVDSEENVLCQDASVSDDYTFSGVIVNDTNPVTITVSDFPCV